MKSILNAMSFFEFSAKYYKNKHCIRGDVPKKYTEEKKTLRRKKKNE